MAGWHALRARALALRRAIGIGTVLVALLVLAGWIFHVQALKSLSPAFPAMKFNSAVCLLLLGSALWAGADGRRHGVVAFCAGSVVAIALITLGEYALGAGAGGFGIDQLVVPGEEPPSHPGRMSANTALAFALLAVAFSRRWTRSPRLYRVRDACCLLASLSVFPGAIGYAYGIHELIRIQSYGQVALHTTLLIVALSLGIALLEPERGLLGELTADTLGSLSLRTVLPRLLVGELALGFVSATGERLGYYGLAFGVAMMVIGSALMAVFFLWRNARELNQVSEERRRSEMELGQLTFERRIVKERRRSSLALEEAVEKLNVALSTAKMAAWSLDLRTMEAWRSAHHHEIFGYKERPAEWSRERFLEHVVPEDRAAFLAAFETGLRMGGFTTTLRVRRVDGALAWLEIQGRAWSAGVDEAGESRLILGVVKDVTERRIADEQLRKALQETSLYQSALDRSAIVALTDAAGRITHVNAKFCEISGYAREEAIGKTHRLVNSGHHPREFFTELWRVISSGAIWRGEICNRAKDGSLYWVDTSIVPCLGDEGRIERYLAVRFDITARKAAEEKLVQAAKMSSLGEMAAGMAHEINTPLAVIQGKAQQILGAYKRGQVDPADVTRKLERIFVTTERIAGIVRGLRSFSRQKESDPMISTPVSRLLNDTLELCRERLRHLEIELRVEAVQDPLLECRSAQIEQVLLNLINNSKDAVAALKEKWIRISVAVAGDRAVISVEDSGSGIPPAIASKMMQPFFTTKEVGKGTGLGLGISKGIVEEHGGRFFYDASARHTRFVVELPLRQAQAPKLAA